MNVEKELKEIKIKLEAVEKSLQKDEKFEECNGLMWSNSIGEDLDWAQARQFAKDCRDGGFDDWRVPTISELQNVFDYEKGESKIKGWIAATYYWSATTRSGSTQNAWVRGQGSGYTYSNTKTLTEYAVRFVRPLK